MVIYATKIDEKDERDIAEVAGKAAAIVAEAGKKAGVPSPQIATSQAEAIGQVVASYLGR